MPREYNMENHHIEMPQQEGASNSTSGLNPPIDASVESVLDIQGIPVVRAQLLVVEGTLKISSDLDNTIRPCSCRSDCRNSGPLTKKMLR